MKAPEIIDMHMHTTVSDGTDTPEEIMEKVRKTGIGLFSVTDHDATGGSTKIKQLLSGKKNGQEPLFITGIEFSCRDDFGRYHILGYAYDETAAPICEITEKAHAIRIRKLYERLAFLKEHFGFEFRDEDVANLLQNENPGKPHIAKLMMHYGYASSIPDAMHSYLNKKKMANAYLLPQQAVSAILKSGGVPVLAHPSLGDGDQKISGKEMEDRLHRLIDFGLEGVEAYYSGFTPYQQAEMLSFAERMNLFVTAGSDYHGNNKTVLLKDTHLEAVSLGGKQLGRFLERVMPYAV